MSSKNLNKEIEEILKEFNEKVSSSELFDIDGNDITDDIFDYFFAKIDSLHSTWVKEMGEKIEKLKIEYEDSIEWNFLQDLLSILNSKE